MKRNSIVLFATLFVLAILAWAGWANYEYRKQAAEKRAAQAALSAKAELIPSASGVPTFTSPLAGKPAPAFTLQDVAGKKVSLADFKGKAVLINFWATWCAPCKIETPWIIELRNKYASQGFEVLGISAEGDGVKPTEKDAWEKDRAAIQKFVQQEKVSYPILMGGDSIADPYGGLDELPESYYIDRKGNVVAATMGLSAASESAAKAEIESNIRKALGE